MKEEEKIKEVAEGIPQTIELRDKTIKCPKCGAEIVVDLDIDVSFISDLAKSFQQMGEDDESDRN